MQLGNDSHASDEVLEQYSMGRLNAQTLKTFEEHLLICATCQDNLEAMDAYRASMRTAARDLRRQAGTRTQEWGVPLFRLPKPVWGLAAAAMVLLVFAGTRWYPTHGAALPPAVVLLQSNRGADNSLNSTMPSAKPFTMILDVTDLPLLPQYRLEIVDADGRSVFGSSATRESHQIRATIRTGLPAGMYFVRVYGTELLREYGLEARD